MTAGIECSLVVYCFGSIFLSLEVFELPYLLLLLGTQLAALQGADPGATVPEGSSTSEAAHEAAPQQGVPCSSIAGP
jgi:hypothetical protein